LSYVINIFCWAGKRIVLNSNKKSVINYFLSLI